MLNLTYIQGRDGLQYPNLMMDAEDVALSKYGWLRKRFLRQHLNGLYTSLLTEGLLDKHCMEVQERAEATKEVITRKLRQQEPRPASDDFMATIRYNRSIDDRAEAFVLQEFIYTITT